MDAFVQAKVIPCIVVDEDDNKTTYEFASLPLPNLDTFRAQCLANLGYDAGTKCSLKYIAEHGGEARQSLRSPDSLAGSRNQ